MAFAQMLRFSLARAYLLLAHGAAKRIFSWKVWVEYAERTHAGTMGGLSSNSWISIWHYWAVTDRASHVRCGGNLPHPLQRHDHVFREAAGVEFRVVLKSDLYLL